MKTIVKIAIIVVVAALPLLFWNNIKTMFTSANATGMLQDGKDDKNDKNDKDDKDGKKGKKNKKDKHQKVEAISPEVKVVDKWELPSTLTEISGLEYVSENRFACIQDEEGKVYIYNTAQNKIEKEIPFASPGDYEGIAIARNSVYVVRSDGRLFEIIGYNNPKPIVKEYETPLTSHDVEGLCYDKKNNRLLMAIKGKEPGSETYKGVYAFSLASKKIPSEPVLKIELNDPVFKDIKEKKATNVIQPSEIEINPVTGDIYISEGTSPKLLIMDANGNQKKLYQMSSSDFQQAEGITFSPQGQLYISNEGKGGSANILKVDITNTN